MRSILFSIVLFVLVSASISSANGQDCDVNLPSGATREQLNSRLKCIQKSVDILMPVGTIIASMLKPDVFADTVGDPAVLDPTKSKWALADKSYVVGSTYAQKHRPQLPDLGGMFLRGINNGRNDGKEDPEGERAPGKEQDDALQNHEHDTNAMALDWVKEGQLQNKEGKWRHFGFTKDGMSINASVTDVKKKEKINTDNEETRPKNVAVYFYIKIN